MHIYVRKESSMSDLRKTIHKGDIWLCDLTEENGGDNCRDKLIKKRYCVVVSSDEWNQISPTYPLILPMSTSEASNGINITCSLGDTKPTSYIRTASIQSVSLFNCIAYKGSLSKEKMKEIDDHLSKSFGLDITKYIDKIAMLEAELTKAKEREQNLLQNLNKNINTEAADLVIENEKLREEIYRLNNVLKYRDRQLTKFSIPIPEADITTATIITGSEGSMEKAKSTIEKEEVRVEKKQYRKGKVTNKVVVKDWGFKKCLNFVKYSESNGAKETMKKYGIISPNTYYKILNTCKMKACVKK